MTVSAVFMVGSDVRVVHEYPVVVVADTLSTFLELRRLVDERVAVVSPASVSGTASTCIERVAIVSPESAVAVVAPESALGTASTCVELWRVVSTRPDIWCVADDWVTAEAVSALVLGRS